MTVLADDQTELRPAKPPGRDCDGMNLGKHQQLGYTVLALVIAAVAFGAAWWLHGNTSSTYRITSQWGGFTGLFILALAIERALEPSAASSGRTRPSASTNRSGRSPARRSVTSKKPP